MKVSNQEKLWLTAHALGLSTAEILSRKNFTQSELKKINALISRRESGEPLQYIMNEADFYGRDFRVGEGVLIPRHDTETLIEAVKRYFAPEQKFSFLDFGTGSGCIAITILLEFKNSFGYMIEKSSDALKFAKINFERYINSERYAISNKIEKNKVDLIISNPPYIPSSEISELDSTVKDYEPHLALDGGIDGMNFYRMILDSAMKILNPKGYIIFEMGNLTQVEAMKNLNHNFEVIDKIYDFGNFPRCLILKQRS